MEEETDERTPIIDIRRPVHAGLEPRRMQAPPQMAMRRRLPVLRTAAIASVRYALVRLGVGTGVQGREQIPGSLGVVPLLLALLPRGGA
jgi:hypothetical protein